MTTLPTTTPMRLPRPVAQTPLALGAPPQAQHGSSFQMSGADAWRVIRSHIWLILGLLIFSAIGGFGLNYYLGKYYSSYTAWGYCQVNPPKNRNLLKGAEQPVQTDVTSLGLEQRTQAQLLRQEALFIQVLQNPNADLRKTKWWNNFKGNVYKAKEDLIDNFRVDVIPESKLISIRMSYSDPKDCKTIVEDIVNQHLENQKVIAQNQQLERSVQLNNLKTKYQFRKDELSRELRERGQRLSIDGIGVTGRLSAKELEMTNLLAAQFDINKNASEADAAYKAAMAQVQDGGDLPSVQNEISKDIQVQSLRAQLNQEDSIISQLQGFGPSYRPLISAKAAREDMQRRLDDAIAERRAQVTASVRTRSRPTRR